MWNWKEFYQLVEQIRKYTGMLYSGESLVQIPQEENMGEPFLLHTISGIYYRNGKESTFCGYHTDQVSAGRLILLYLKKIMNTEEVLFNAVFLGYGGKKQGTQLRKQHGIRMVYRRFVDPSVDVNSSMGKNGEKRTEFFLMNDSFQKLVVIGRKENEIRKATIAELLNVFGMAADEKGLLLLSEQNSRILCQGNGMSETLQKSIVL